MIIPGFTKTYGRNRVLNFPGMEFTPGRSTGSWGQTAAENQHFPKFLPGSSRQTKSLHLFRR